MTDKKKSAETGAKVSKAAAKTLSSAKAPSAHKGPAGSAVSQTGTDKKTSPAVAKVAAKQASPKTPKVQKSIDASVLRQTEKATSKKR